MRERRFPHVRLPGVALLAVLSTGCLEMVVPDKGSIEVKREPAVLDRDSLGTISVLALGEDHAPVMDGTRVYFSTDLGTLLPYADHTGVETVAPGDTVLDVGTHNGVARALFHSGGVDGTATVTVKSGTHKQDVTFTVGRTPVAIFLTAQGQSGESGSVLPPEGGAVTLTAWVYDVDSYAVDEADVIFSTTEGVLDSAGGRVKTSSDGTVEDVLTTDLTAQVTCTVPIIASGNVLVSEPITITVPGPEILTVYPNTGTSEGGDEVAITGSNFAYGARVLFGIQEGIPVDPTLTPETWNDREIRVYTPGTDNGDEVVTVKVENPNGEFAMRDSGFAYVAPPEPEGGP